MKHLVEPIRSLEEVSAVENYLKRKNKRNFLIFVLGINTGLRISDILGLDVKDVLNTDFIEITEKKTKKYKKIKLNKKLKNLLNIYIKDKKTIEPLFTGKQHKRLNRSQVYRFLNEACKDVGIKSNIGTHTLRKTFGFFFTKNIKILFYYKRFLTIQILI